MSDKKELTKNQKLAFEGTWNKAYELAKLGDQLEIDKQSTIFACRISLIDNKGNEVYVVTRDPVDGEKLSSEMMDYLKGVHGETVLQDPFLKSLCFAKKDSAFLVKRDAHE